MQEQRINSFRKNDMIDLYIEDMGSGGEGIGKVKGLPFFVKDAVIGDHITAKVTKLKKNYGYGRLINIREPSPHRVTAECGYYKQCGGCQLQSLAYAQQLRCKEEKVRNNLIRIGGFTDIFIEPIEGMGHPFHYRNKAVYPVGRNKEGEIIAGFYMGRSHTIVANTDCCLGVPVNETVLNIVIAFMKKYGIMPYDEKTGAGLVRHILIRFGFRTKEIMVCLIINGKKLVHCERLVEELVKLAGMTSISINMNERNTNVIMGEEVRVLWGQSYISDYIDDIEFQISPLSFYQINPQQTEKLYKTALEFASLTGNETVWDLYCGIGTISLFLSCKAKHVYGVEVIPQAVEDAKKNASINKIENVTFFTGKSEEVLPVYYGKKEMKPEVIVLDPPRKGCDEALLHTIVQMQPERIVYVSCDSATLARDLKYLGEGGFEIRRVKPVDMFGQTVHVETCVLLSRKKDMDVINIEMVVEQEDVTEKATYKKIQAYVEEKYGF